MLDYVINLAKRHTDEIGFIPISKLKRYWDNDQIWIETENDEPCGFLVFGNGWPVLRIYQACIQYDAQRQHHGLALIKRLILKAEKSGYDCILLHCGDDLDANMFWKRCGFVFVGKRRGGNRRNRWLNCWVFWLSNPQQMRLFEPKGYYSVIDKTAF